MSKKISASDAYLILQQHLNRAKSRILFEELSNTYTPQEQDPAIYDEFDRETIVRVWHKGRKISNFNSTEWRHDRDGKVIRYWNYGDCESEYGWEIHRVLTATSDNIDPIHNFIPLHWRTNAAHSGRLDNQ